ncbi:MAG TPA: hypothetical protein VFM94_06685 [Solirubrobacterales bacterium]|nr:hypothetical protein [Solirubrobacterales bacterium]
MRAFERALPLAATTLALCAPAAQAGYPAQGGFGLDHFDVTFTEADGSTATQAGAHPFAMTTQLAANVDSGEGLPEGWLRDLFIAQIPGLAGDTTAYPRCTTLEFLEIDGETGINSCPLETAVGISGSAVNGPGQWFSAPVFNIEPPPGVLLRLGFRALVQNVVVDVVLDDEPPYLPVVVSHNIPQLADLYANKTQIWGDPSDPAHDGLRGVCASDTAEGLPPSDPDAFQFEGNGESCPLAQRGPRAFLTTPTNCSGALATTYEAFSWEGPSILDDGFDAGSSLTHGPTGKPQAFTGCGALATFDPRIEASPTSRAAESPTGLDFELAIDDEGLLSNEPGAHAKSQIREVRVTLPEGMTANPSLAEGLEVCSESDLNRETLDSTPGAGCPQASKIGAIEVDTPLVSETIGGSLYQAQPHANLADDALIAFYIVLRNRDLGILVKQPVRVQANPRTGQLEAVTEEIPQLPFSSFRLKFKEGGRSPLVSPPRCGTHTAQAEIVPWSGGPIAQVSSSFEIVSGPGGGPCPEGSLPFSPGFVAGSVNNTAGAYSPFSMRLTRRDGDQDLVRFDATLPPGLIGRLTGVARCPEAQIAAARTKTGKAELASPSCPLGSLIGHAEAGAGVGSQLTYVPGRLYLAGPFAGAPLSVVAIVPAVAGPFDVGTVVTRQALRVDPRTGVVTADGRLSDPIPHILAGIPLRVRDIQVHVDRAGFTLNPTSCEPMSAVALIWGGGQDPFGLFDDAPVSRAVRFQASDCASLAFSPRLGLRLKGGTARGAHPALRAVFRPRAGQANTKRVVVRFPRSAFVEQAHIRTVCTRVQFAADACPKGSIYGRVTAFTPLLDNPLRGPVYLRSSSNVLPDLVFDLTGEVDFEAVVRIDSIRGALRAITDDLPDAPIEKVVIEMQGGRKSLIVNSTDLCGAKNRAQVRLEGHNAKRHTLHSTVRAQCQKRRRPPG